MRFGPATLVLLSAAGVCLLSSCSEVRLAAVSGGSGQGNDKQTPVITWAQPAPILYPAPLTGVQLDATANVAGRFEYSPPTGTVLQVGSHTLRAHFIPADPLHYNTAEASVTIVVNQSRLAVSDLYRILIYDAPFTTNENAGVVLGQPNMNSYDFPSPSADRVDATALATDEAGDLFAANDCSVLEFQPPFTDGMNASVIIGQPDFTSTDCPGGRGRQPASVTASQVVGPSGVAVDAQGNLWVADFYISRITEYRPPFTNGEAATLAIGQQNLTDAYECNGANFQRNGYIPPPTASTLCSPSGIAFDAQGNLWVNDFGNYRILRFSPPFSTGMAANLEIGYPAEKGFETQESSGPSATSLCEADDIAIDKSGNLWVADTGCYRVLEFVPPFTSGMAASLVLGQPDFTTTNPSPAPPMADDLTVPVFLTVDVSGEVIVGDYCRVMIFAPPLSNGMSASQVIGQSDFTSMNCWGPPGPNTLHSAYGVVAF